MFQAYQALLPQTRNLLKIVLSELNAENPFSIGGALTTLMFRIRHLGLDSRSQAVLDHKINEIAVHVAPDLANSNPLSLQANVVVATILLQGLALEIDEMLRGNHFC